MDTETNPSTHPEVSNPVDSAAPPAPWKRWVRWGAVALVAIVIGYFIFGRGGGGGTKYTTQEVTRGDLTVTVTATGNLEPRNQVDIGSELSGTIRSVAVDVNDTVKAGQVLTKLDTSRLEAQVLQAQSSLASAEARVLQSVAGSKEARANLARLQKVRELSGNKLPSQQDMDVAESAVAQAEGEEAAARAAVAQARANLDVVKTDLGKTDIRSPINGIVLVRSVEPGQTVAASLQAPVLFTLAEDLKKMELHVAVDEADIGSVEVGQKATFTVDAFPNRQFHATITRVDFASNNTQKSASSGSSQSSGGEQRDVDRRRDVRNRARSGQLGPAAAPGHDRDGGDRDHEHSGRNRWCRTQRCASRRKASTCPVRRTRKLRAVRCRLSCRRCRAASSAASNAAAGAWAASGCSKTASLRWRIFRAGRDRRPHDASARARADADRRTHGLRWRTTRSSSRRSSARSSPA